MLPLSYAPPPRPHTRSNPGPSHKAKVQPCALPFPDALRAAAAAAAISLSLLAGNATGALEVAAAAQPPQICRSGGAAREAEVRAEAVTNEQLVEEAWEVVNEGFLTDAGSRPWSTELWMQRKQDIGQSSIRSRSRAHDIIRKMLASLGDPYTRFLSPSEFSKMSKYDMTGIGLNLREIPDDNSSFKLMVLGLILDGPAHSAGVRQGDELLSVNGIDVRGKSAFDVSSMLQGPKETFVTIKVKHGECGPVESMKVQRQLVARTPVFYRLEKRGNDDSSVGYIHIKEFNAVAKKDLHLNVYRIQVPPISFWI